MSNRQQSAPRLSLAGYYWLEGLNSFGCTLFVCCVYFWTRQRFHYSDTANLFLNATQGIVYVVAARCGGRLSDAIGYDRQIILTLAAMVVCMLVGWLPPWMWTPFAVVAVYGALMGMFWPALEAVIMHAPAALTMPQRTGVYNMTWAVAAIGGYFCGGVVFRINPDLVLLVPGAVHVAELLLYARRAHAASAAGKGAMDIPHRGDDVAPVLKQRFMYTAWLANALGYFMIAGFQSLTPYIGLRLHLEPAYMIWLACTMYVARSAAFVVFWKWERWHYHMAWSYLAVWTAPVALAGIFFAPSVWLVFCALALFGVALGLSYSGSLYYSLDYGEQKGEHSGLHESILGMGVLAGPLVGGIAALVTGNTRAAQAAIVVVVFLATAAGLWWISRRTHL